MAIKFLSDPTIRNLTGDSAPTLWRKRRAGLFPKPTKVGLRKNGTPEDEYDFWAIDPQTWPQRYAARKVVAA